MCGEKSKMTFRPVIVNQGRLWGRYPRVGWLCFYPSYDWSDQCVGWQIVFVGTAGWVVEWLTNVAPDLRRQLYGVGMAQPGGKVIALIPTRL